MKSNLYLLVFSADHQNSNASIMVHFWENLQSRLQKISGPETNIESVSWHQDPLVKMLMQRMVTNSEGGSGFLDKFIADIGYFKIVIESDHSYQYKYIPWIEAVIKRMHEEMEFSLSDFFYLVKNNENEVVFHSFSKIHIPNLDSDADDGIFCPEMNSYAGLFNDYFYSESICDSFAPDAARLYLLGGSK